MRNKDGRKNPGQLKILDSLKFLDEMECQLMHHLPSFVSFEENSMLLPPKNLKMAEN